MKAHRLPILIACTVLCGAIATAQDRSAAAPHFAGTQPFHAKIAGTCTNKDDFSFTGTAPGLVPGGALRIHCVVAGDSTHGHYAAQILTEEQVTATPCTQPGDVVGFQAVVRAYIMVLSFTSTQDQLFLRLGSSGSQCLTPPGTIAGGQGVLAVIGGTGRFEGASGLLNHIISPIALAFSATGGDGFLSAFTGTLDGSVTLQ